MRKGLTEIVLVLDRSGSMESIKGDAEGGLRGFINDQKKAPGEARLTFYRFDYSPELVFENRDLRYVEPHELKLEPRGSTALVDAMVRAIDEVGRRLERLQEWERPEHVVFVTVTDGQENSSKQFVNDDLYRRIRTQRELYKWNFVFIGCTEDSIAQAVKLWGYDPNLVLRNTFSGPSYHATYSVMTSNVSNLRKGMGAQSLNFTDSQRAQVNDETGNTGDTTSASQ